MPDDAAEEHILFDEPETEVTDRSLSVEGFKALRDRVDLSLRPLTLICGNNSSGKSSALQPLLLIKQTLEAPYDPGPLLLDGPNLVFNNFSEVLWRGRQHDDRAEAFSITYTDYDYERVRLTFGVGESAGVELRELAYQPPAYFLDAPEVVLRPGLSGDTLRRAVRPFLSIALPETDWRLRLVRRRCFFEVAANRFDPNTGRERPSPGPSLTEFNFFRQVATNLIHLPGLRDNPSRFYPATEVSSVFPGPFQPYAASVIASWQERKDPRLRALGNQLAAMELTWKAAARRLDDTRIALRVGRLPRPQQGGAQDLVNVADVGLGVSQSLPVLVALLVAREGQIVLLEQPELHLHPRAQVALGPILGEAARRGVIVVCETHSYLLLRSLQQWVASGRTRHQLVKVHWFTRDEDGATRVDSADLDPEGAFGDWPVDFAEIEMQVEERYLSTVLGIQ